MNSRTGRDPQGQVAVGAPRHSVGRKAPRRPQAGNHRSGGGFGVVVFLEAVSVREFTGVPVRLPRPR